MKKLTKKYSVQLAGLLLLLALLPVSCIKDDYAPKGTATVTMTFTTRAISNSTTRATGDLLDNEQMKTLRVIVARSSNSEILYNVKYSIEASETSKTITFSELTVNKAGEDFDFYAIANEDGFLSTGESLDGTSVNLTDLYNRKLTGGFDKGATLPQVGYREIKVKPQESGIQKEDMKLDFPAGKIQLTFVNETGKDITLTNVKVPSVAPNQAYLFFQGNTPGGTTLTGNVDFGSITVPSGTESVPTSSSSEYRYIYPGAAGEGKYKLAATWGSKNFEELLKTTNAPNGISSIPRNSLVNIVITLKSGGGFGVKCEVNDWNDVSYDYTLSDAGQFTITEPNAKDFTYDTNKKAIATQYSTESGASSRQATFTVKMKTPVGVRWMAHLTNAQDFEFVTDESHAAEGVGGSSPVTLLIRPTKSFDATGERPYTELYVTLGTAPDNKQRFVEPGQYCSSDGTSIPIVQVSATEGDALWGTSVEP